MLSKERIEGPFKAFARDRKAAMWVQPPKLGEVTPIFTKDDIATRDYVVAHDTTRKLAYTMRDGVMLKLEDVLPGRAPYADNDRVENLVDEVVHRRPADMDAADLREAELAESPWSDDYWPTYMGQLGRRYADPDFPSSSDWQKNRDFTLARSARDVVASGNQTAIDQLSPSEKWDILVGDSSNLLTQQSWAQGKGFYDRDGKVESWMGICHGWAPAAYMLGRPRAPVEVVAPDGTKLRFFPFDIKSLASLLWANAHTETRFIGGRCNDKDPSTDESGRITSERCFDTNPGTWHLSVINQIGHARRSFIIDATYDYEVWNQPVFGYEYAYVNPRSGEHADTLEAATVKRSSFDNDAYKGYRADATESIVGVAMALRYVAETSPRHTESDDASQDKIITVDYHYDLELDAAGEIIGGEWYNAKHPDFLWTPPQGARARSPSDFIVQGTWDRGQPVPESWRKAAWFGAGNPFGAVPLAAIVEQLIEWANQ